MTELSRTQYVDKINSIATNMAAEALADNDNDIDAARKDIYDSRLHETIDGHRWIIYYAYNLDVIRHSDNADAYSDNLGPLDMAAVLKERGLDGLHNVIAYYAMYADVSDALNKQWR
jgi:hypothetical protein